MNIQLLNLLRGPWAITREYSDLYFHLAAGILSGLEIEVGEEPEETKPYALRKGENKTYSIYDEAPQGSIAVLNLSGLMTKNDQFCGPVGTATLAKRIIEADKHKNISSIVLVVNSGGGHTNSVPILREAIKQKTQKPFVAFFDDTAASAALMAVASAKHIIAAHTSAGIGSLGVMANFRDNRPVAEKEGVVFHEVYAAQSTQKNIEITEAMKGNYKPLLDNVLNPLANEAIANYKSDRPQVTNEDFFKGKMFFATEALQIGAIDEIGSFERAIEKADELAKLQNSTSNSQTSNNFSQMKKNQIPALSFVLGIESLESIDNKYSLTKEQIAAVQDRYMKLTNKSLTFKGATFEDDDSATITESGLYSLNEMLTNAIVEANTALATAQSQALIDAQAQIEALSKKPEDFKKPVVALVGGAGVGKFAAIQSGLNAVDALHPWNEAALSIANGNRSYAHFIIANGLTKHAMDAFQQELITFGASTLGIAQMNETLGAFHRADAQEIKDMLVANEEINSLFPLRSTGIKDELPNLTLYASEFLQPRNTAWAEKGGFEIQADIIKIKNWQVSHRYTAAQMWGFIESWLATKTAGTDPFQESLVQWFTKKMMFQIAMVEKPVNAIRGVYVTPQEGVAGKSINSQDGILINLKKLIKDLRVKITKVGPALYNHFDENGNINRNHIYYKINDVIKSMPQSLRDSGTWNVYVSKEDVRARDIFIKQVVATDANYVQQEQAESYPNFKIVGVPHWVDGLIVITLPGNILQGYREKSDDNRIYFDKEKRDTIVFMDGGSVIAPVLSGYKYANLAALEAADGMNQRIFTNAEFGAFTPIDMVANDTTPSILVHNVLRTVANTAATTITTIDDTNVGDVIYIIGGSNTNASKILATNTKFIGVASDITFTTGVVAKFLVTAVDKFTMLALYQEKNQGAILLDANDVTPDVSEGYLFITNAENSAATAITNFDGATVGVPFKVLGGGGVNASTIAKSGKFAYISAAWTATEGAEITLMKRPDGTFVQV